MQKFQIVLVVLALGVFSHVNCGNIQNSIAFLQGYASEFGQAVQLSQLKTQYDVIGSMKEGSMWLMRGNLGFALKYFSDFCKLSNDTNNAAFASLKKGISQACQVYYTDNLFFSKAVLKLNNQNPNSVQEQAKAIFEILNSPNPEITKAGTLFAQLTQKILAEQNEMEKTAVSQLLYGLYLKYGSVSQDAKNQIAAKVQPGDMQKLLAGIDLYQDEEAYLIKGFNVKLTNIIDFFNIVKGYGLNLGEGQTKAFEDIDRLYSNKLQLMQKYYTYSRALHMVKLFERVKAEMRKDFQVAGSVIAEVHQELLKLRPPSTDPKMYGKHRDLDDFEDDEDDLDE